MVALFSSIGDDRFPAGLSLRSRFKHHESAVSCCFLVARIALAVIANLAAAVAAAADTPNR